MSKCGSTNLNDTGAGKACSGKCMGNACDSSRTWVLAACSGMISLFELRPDRHLSLMLQGKQPSVTSVDLFQTNIVESAQQGKFRQLVLIGSATDIAWLHALLPEAAARYISAEIPYPLIPDWFRGVSVADGKLTHALEQVLAG